MPPGETTEDHRKWQEEEAAAVEKDRISTGRRGGLFRGCFRAHLGHPPLLGFRQAAIRDVEDGVDRCPRCTWELEDGLCQECGYPSELEEWSDSDGPEHFPHDVIYGDEDEMESTIIDALMDNANLSPNFGREYSPASVSERHYSSDNESYGTPPDNHYRLAGPRYLPVGGPPQAGTPYDSLQEDSDESLQEDNDEFTEDDEDAGSLDGFLVDDLAEPPRSRSESANRLIWSSDEGSQTDNAQEQDHEMHDNDRTNLDGAFSTTGPAVQYNLDDDSDEGPVPPSRRRVARRSAAPNASSDEDSSLPTSANRRHNRGDRSRRRTTTTTDMQSKRPHRSRHEPHSNGRSSGVPIQIDSDSDAPVSASQPNRRSRAQPPTFSEDSDVEISSGTVTLGRPSPGSMQKHDRSTSKSINDSSPIVIGSNSRQPEMNGNGPFPRSENDSGRINQSTLFSGSRQLANLGPPQPAPDSLNEPAHRSGPSFSPYSRINRRISPVPYRSHIRSPAPESSRPATAQEEFDQGVRQRQAQKAERKSERRRIKAERDRRREASAVQLASSSRGS